MVLQTVGERSSKQPSGKQQPLKLPSIKNVKLTKVESARPLPVKPLSLMSTRKSTYPMKFVSGMSVKVSKAARIELNGPVKIINWSLLDVEFKNTKPLIVL
jgi:hypothetical protein